MELFLVIGGIWLLGWIAKHAYKVSFQPERHPRTETNPQTGPQDSPKKVETYRPHPRGHGGSLIVFPGPSNEPERCVPAGGASFEGLHDAFTGASLNPALGLHHCTNCKVYYHTGSLAVLRAENGARCVACAGASIISVTAKEATTKSRKGRDYKPDVVTLANFRSHFDRVVTFEGTVRAVKVSKRGLDYAVMFEHASWSRGLKLVFFRGTVENVGGPEFILELKDRRVRVRGLLLNHRLFGPQIVVSERRMILGVG